MTIPRSRFALLFAVPSDIRTRGRIVAPGSAAWDRHFPELQFMGEIEGVAFSQVPAGIERWQAMIRWIHAHASTVDGVVIVHDRELLIPGAVVLDLACASLPCPMIITVPSPQSPQDWRTNVVVALQSAVVAVPGPIVVDGNRIVRAGTVTWEMPDVIGGGSAARLDFGVRRIPQRRSGEATITDALTTELTVIEMTPGFALPPVPSRAINILIRVPTTPDWSALERWAKRLPKQSRVMVQTTVRLPATLRDWAQLPTAEDDVVIVQAAWIFGQGPRWKRSIRTALERRRL